MVKSGGTNWNGAVLVAVRLPSVMETSPLAAVDGTVRTIAVLVQLVMLADGTCALPNLTVPWVAPNPLP